MARSFKEENPLSRTHLYYDPMGMWEGDRRELPFRLLVLGDFLGREPAADLPNRARIRINRDNFDEVLQRLAPSLSFTVTDRSGDGIEVQTEEASGERDGPLRLDPWIADFDAAISRQLDDILHHPAFQRLEAAWRGLQLLVDRTDFRRNVQIELLCVSKETLGQSFEHAASLHQAFLYEHICHNPQVVPQEDPYGAIIANYSLNHSPQDLALLQHVAQVAATAHCPFIAMVGPSFFNKTSWAPEWNAIPDLKASLETDAYRAWNAFRDTDSARYVGLTLPRFLLRLPYGLQTVPTQAFNYVETVSEQDHCLWGNAAYAFAINLVRAFAMDGLGVQISGPRSGGEIEDLLAYSYAGQQGKFALIATETPISDTREFECADLGFIPLIAYTGGNHAVFYSANTTHRPHNAVDVKATFDNRMNARLPFVLLGARFMHYLKAIRKAGGITDRERLEEQLQAWIQGYVTRDHAPPEQVVRRRPLKAATVQVHEDYPGVFRMELSITPHPDTAGLPSSGSPDLTIRVADPIPWVV